MVFTSRFFLPTTKLINAIWCEKFEKKFELVTFAKKEDYLFCDNSISNCLNSNSELFDLAVLLEA